MLGICSFQIERSEHVYEHCTLYRELEDLNVSLEEAASTNAAQVRQRRPSKRISELHVSAFAKAELARRREDELTRLRRELEESQLRHDSQVV